MYVFRISTIFPLLYNQSDTAASALFEKIDNSEKI